MPLYEYTCPRCDGYFEARVPLRDYEKPLPCPNCKVDGEEVELKRRISATYFTVRGN